MEIQPFSSDNSRPTVPDETPQRIDSDCEVDGQQDEDVVYGQELQAQFDRRLFIAMVVKGEPIELLDSPCVRELIYASNPHILCPTSEEFNTVVLRSMYETARTVVWRKLDRGGWYSINLQLVSRANGERYVVVLFHGTTEAWTHERGCLGILPCDMLAIPLPLTDLLPATLKDWNIDLSSVVGIVSDTSLGCWNISQERLPCLRMPCVFSTMNRAANKAFATEPMRTALARMEQLIAFLLSNPTARKQLDQRLTECQESCDDLYYDGPAWTATHKRAKWMCAHYEPVVNTFTQLDVDSCPNIPAPLTNEQWALLREGVLILDYVEAAWAFLRQQPQFGPGLLLKVVSRLDAHLYVYSNACPRIRAFCKALHGEILIDFGTMLNCPSGPVLLAIFLDPRTKAFDFQYDIQYRGRLTRNAVATSIHEIPEMRTPYHEPRIHSIPPVSLHGTSGEPLLPKLHLLFGEAMVKDNTGSVSSGIVDELKRYVRAPPCPLFDESAIRNQGAVALVDPLHWWANNEHLYPHLAPLAERILSMTASAPSYTNIFAERMRDVRDAPPHIHMFPLLNAQYDQHYEDVLTTAQVEFIHAMEEYDDAD